MEKQNEELLDINGLIDTFCDSCRRHDQMQKDLLHAALEDDQSKILRRLQKSKTKEAITDELRSIAELSLIKGREHIQEIQERFAQLKHTINIVAAKEIQESSTFNQRVLLLYHCGLLDEYLSKRTDIKISKGAIRTNSITYKDQVVTEKIYDFKVSIDYDTERDGDTYILTLNLVVPVYLDIDAMKLMRKEIQQSLKNSSVQETFAKYFEGFLDDYHHSADKDKDEDENDEYQSNTEGVA